MSTYLDILKRFVIVKDTDTSSENLFFVTKPAIDGYKVAVADSDIILMAYGSSSIFDIAIDYYEWTLPDESKYQGDTLIYHVPFDFNVGDIFVLSCIAVDVSGHKSIPTNFEIEIVASLEYPVIDSLDWDEDEHEENRTYELTIIAHDPQGQDLTYQLICDDDENVTITQDELNLNIFHITYFEYIKNAIVTYTASVTNEDLLTDVETDIKSIINIPESGDRGIFGGGYSNGYLDIIEYVEISTPGDAVDFGDLTLDRYMLSSTSNGVSGRGIFAGGDDSSYVNIIDYITILSPGNATDFGDLITVRRTLTSTSNGINDRGIFAGGDDGTETDLIDYITIPIFSNAVDFGDLTIERSTLAACSNGINERGIFGGGYSIGYSNIIDYITIPTPGDATDFGDLTIEKHGLSSTSNGINDRGVFGGGWNSGYFDTIEYITISTIGNATDFGDLLITRYNLTSTSNGINDRGVFGGGYNGIDLNTIDYIDIMILGNATDFGDLSTIKNALAACSDG